MYEILLALFTQVARWVTPPMTKEGLLQWLQTAVSMGETAAKYFTPNWDYDDKAVAMVKGAIDNPAIYNIIWSAVDAIFNQDGTEEEALTSASARLGAMADGEKAGIDLLSLIALIQAIIAIFKKVFNK